VNIPRMAIHTATSKLAVYIASAYHKTCNILGFVEKTELYLWLYCFFAPRLMNNSTPMVIIRVTVKDRG